MPPMDHAFFSTYFLPATLVLIMGGMGLSLSLQNFRNVLRFPKAVVVGLVAQMVVLPLLAFGLAHAFGLSPTYAAGLMIVASCPGGASAGQGTCPAFREAPRSLLPRDAGPGA